MRLRRGLAGVSEVEPRCGVEWNEGWGSGSLGARTESHSSCFGAMFYPIKYNKGMGMKTTQNDTHSKMQQRSRVRQLLIHLQWQRNVTDCRLPLGMIAAALPDQALGSPHICLDQHPNLWRHWILQCALSLLLQTLHGVTHHGLNLVKDATVN